MVLKKGTKIAEDKKSAGLPSDKDPMEYGKDIIRQLVKFMTAGPVLIKGLGTYATPLPFMDYLINEPVMATALYGRGVPVSVPNPARYALHKLTIAKRRRAQRQKSPKDVAQAWSLVEALAAFDHDSLIDAVLDAKRRGGDLKVIAAEVGEVVSPA